MYDISVSLTAVLMIVASLGYVRDTWRKKITPVPATWILMVTVLALSFWMYWHSPEKSWSKNVGVIAGTLSTLINLAGVLATNIRDKSLNLAFNPVQTGCMIAAGVILMMYKFTNNPLMSYGLIQLIAVIAYTATVIKLRRAASITEPLYFWVALFLASLCALYPAIVGQDIFSWVYLARAIPGTGGMVYLIWKIQRRQDLAKRNSVSK